MNKIDDSNIDPIVESAGDKAYRLTRTALSAIPGFGGAAVEIFSALITPPLEKRRIDWMKDVTKSINELLEQERFSFEDLQNNEQFITTLVQASQIALRNHYNEKWKALHNAVINSASPTAPEEDLQAMFLGMIDIFTQWHLIILKYCDENEGINIDYKPSITIQSVDPSMPSKSKIESQYVHQQSKHLENAFLQLKGKSQFYMLVLFELSQRSLVERTGNIRGTPPADDWFKITDLGKQFIRFISRSK